MHHSGVYRVPEVIITDFKGKLFLLLTCIERKNLLSNDIKEIRDEAYEFIEVFVNEEMTCRMENNKFNLITRDNPVQ